MLSSSSYISTQFDDEFSRETTRLFADAPVALLQPALFSFLAE